MINFYILQPLLIIIILIIKSEYNKQTLLAINYNANFIICNYVELKELLLTITESHTND